MSMVKLSYLWYVNSHFEQINVMGNVVLKVFSIDTLMLESVQSIILLFLSSRKMSVRIQYVMARIACNYTEAKSVS